MGRPRNLKDLLTETLSRFEFLLLWYLAKEKEPDLLRRLPRGPESTAEAALELLALHWDKGFGDASLDSTRLPVLFAWHDSDSFEMEMLDEIRKGGVAIAGRQLDDWFTSGRLTKDAYDQIRACLCLTQRS